MKLNLNNQDKKCSINYNKIGAILKASFAEFKKPSEHFKLNFKAKR